MSHEILQETTLRERLLQQLASYEPAVTMAKSSTLHHHKIYYPSHASFMQEVIKALENLPILIENASTIESQALVAQTLMHISLQFSQNVHGETHFLLIIITYVYVILHLYHDHNFRCEKRNVHWSHGNGLARYIR